MSNFTPQSSNTNHKVTEDKLVQALHQTRPVGSSQHRDELEARLLGLLEAQSQSTDERHPNMQAQARSNIIPIRKIRISPILVATLAMILLGAGLLFAYSSASPPDKGSHFGQGVGTDTATPIPTLTSSPTLPPQQITATSVVMTFAATQGTFYPVTEVPNPHCPVETIGIAQRDLTVYSEDNLESDVLGEYPRATPFMVIGQNYTGEWLAVLWSDNFVGWIDLASLVHPDIIAYNNCNTWFKYNETDSSPTVVPTGTPIGTETATESCELYSVRMAQLLNETTVYARPDMDADELDTLAAETIVDIIGVNREQDWFVIQLDTEYIGWIEISLENLQLLNCVHGEVVEIMVDPTALPPVNDGDNSIVTPTPILSAQEMTATSVIATFEATLTGTPGVNQFTPTVVPPAVESCPFAAIGTAQDDVTVYELDSTESDELGSFTTDEQFIIIGQNYTGDWLVVQWSEGYVGWIQIPTTETAEFTTITCDELLNAVWDVDFNDMTATVLLPTAVPTSTPFGVEPLPESCELDLVPLVQVLNETIVYARPDMGSDELDTLDAETIIQIIGVNREQDWFVIQLEAGYVGWIEVSVENIQFLTCAQGDIVESMMTPTAFAPTVVPPSDSGNMNVTATSSPVSTAVPTSTPIPSN